MVTDGVEPCTYCGEPADSIDHIPPRHMRKQLQELGTYIGIVREVPACRWCNSTLGCRPLLDIKSRRLYIKEHLRRKFKRLLKGRNWSEDEVNEMGQGLQGYLRENNKIRSEIRARLAWAGNVQSKILIDSGLPTQLEGRTGPSWGLPERTEWLLKQTCTFTPKPAKPHSDKNCSKVTKIVTNIKPGKLGAIERFDEAHPRRTKTIAEFFKLETPEERELFCLLFEATQCPV